MSGDVPGEISSAAVPAGVRLRLLRQTGAHAIERHHAVGLEREQIFRVGVLRELERSAGDAYVGQRNRPRPQKLLFDLPGARTGTPDVFGAMVSARDSCVRGPSVSAAAAAAEDWRNSRRL